ncbi:sporulation protein YunB [Scopulibacillus darangshiensis]|uniref:Sporulation protein YunB n=1 Tax=Scopulibacillus darangshiensis TaxID=442528 RepID=A0A4R2NDJ5_9BACL|nr:sporulation protein YunB [Scopulibacillus darangshiensis]TCP19132.1 sporulation protein YunB [Scopulibacillus darangshiensis]
MFKPKKTYRRRIVAFRHVFVIAMVFFIIFTMWGLWIIDRGIEPALMKIAENQAQQVAMYAINFGVGKQTIKNMEEDLGPTPLEQANKNQLIITDKDQNGDVSNAVYNGAEITRIQNATSRRIQWFLRRIEKGELSAENLSLDLAKVEGDSKGTIAEIPLGQATNNAILTNLGPTVPVRLDLIGSVLVEPVIEKKLVGINFVSVDIKLHIKVDVNVVIPFTVKMKPIEQDIVIKSQVIRGDVPDYYQNGGNSSGGMNPAVPLPKKDSKKDNNQKKNGQ